jgi:hypothetical protein
MSHVDFTQFGEFLVLISKTGLFRACQNLIGMIGKTGTKTELSDRIDTLLYWNISKSVSSLLS